MLAGAFAFDAIVETGKRALEYASSLDEVSQQLGVTATDLQTFRYAASQVGISNEEMDKGLQKFTKSLGEARAGSAAAIGVFNQLGISQKEIANDSTHQLLLKTADGIGKIGDNATRSAPEIALFGKAGQKLDTLLSGGSKGILELTHAAEDLGLVLSHDEIENADRTADKISELKQVLEASIAKNVADNAASIYDLVSSLEKLVTKIPTAINYLKQLQAQVQIYSSKAQIVGGYPTLDAEQRANGRAGVADGQDKLYALQIEQAQRNVPGFARSSIDSLDGLGGGKSGKGYTDPAAHAAAAAARKKAAEDAKRAAKEAARAQSHFDSELGRSQSDILGLQGDLTANLADRNQNARQQIEIERKTKNDTIALDDKLTSAQKATLTGLNDQAAKLALRKINYQDELTIDKETVDIATARLEASNDLLGSAQQLARTAKERQQIELKLLANARAQEEAKLKPILDDESRSSTNRHYSDAEIEAAKKQSAGLDAKYNSKAAVVANNNQGPLASYLDAIPKTADEINESLQGVATNGLSKLSDGLTAAITGTGTLKDAFKGLASSIIADLAKIAIEQALIKPLASALFGGGSSSIGGGVLSSLFGSIFGKRANGGITQPGDYLIGERGPEIMSIGATANITPNSRIVANDNSRPNINVTVNRVNDPAMIRKLATEAIVQALPTTTRISTAATMERASYPRLR